MTTPQTQGLVERLEAEAAIAAAFDGSANAQLLTAAAQALRSLASRNEGLEEALKPFAEAANVERSYASNLTPSQIAHAESDEAVCGFPFTNGQVRKARLSLSPEEGG